MSTQVLENETTGVTELNAETVKNVLSGTQRRSATRLYPFTVEIYEKFGRVFIGWKVDLNYPIGHEDTVQLREGTTIKYNRKTTGHQGDFDTGHTWGSGMNASYWGLDDRASSNPWRQLVVTEDT